ncbi:MULTISPECIES: ACP phosphodiesterase [unclassified Lentimicrobium]|uniref:acyl carrier protein phosphodiesterase n=1 Tax=unclassified Lentimicrobium TaxID=2677434 RepID=UPI0015519BE3|nr:MULTISPECIES: ACP phosphodiesterase [unclassified Lentimicrobium]NPD47555.1 DUF479 domain-containing protein [Lentimicrobium sp. S6]NPD86354.1 DUF479 domain-containing protein [Lentimicrobium sp. L6]
MNFLAHIYLSGNNKEIALGNLIGDMVKGNAYENYPKDIRTGLILHRSIDEFTDAHLDFKHSCEIIKPYFNRYAGIVADIYYDHFLAKYWSEFSDIELQKTVNDIYILMIKKYRLLPARAQRIAPFMILRNWLGTYGHFEPLHQVFLGMHRRTSEKGHMDIAVQKLKVHYEELEKDFRLFMPDVIEFSNKKLSFIPTIID